MLLHIAYESCIRDNIHINQQTILHSMPKTKTTNASTSLEKIKIVQESVASHKTSDNKSEDNKKTKQIKEFGGRGGLEPTRFGDWEKNGRCIDF